jgi:hypothetical protein
LRNRLPLFVSLLLLRLLLCRRLVFPQLACDTTERAVIQADILALVVDSIELGQAETALSVILVLWAGPNGEDAANGLVLLLVAVVWHLIADLERRCAKDLLNEREEAWNTGANEHAIAFDAVEAGETSATVV